MKNLFLSLGLPLIIGLHYGGVNCDQHNRNQLSNINYCKDMSPQGAVDMDQIMGMWIGNEVITHQEMQESETVYDSCITIHLSEVIDDHRSTTELNLRPGDYGYQKQQSNRNRNRNFDNNHHYRKIRLVWNEKDSILEYVLQFNDTRKGFWYSLGPHKETMLNLPSNQFIGTIQVMKAVGNHLVLSFCQSFENRQLFSVILTRDSNTISNDDITSIRNLLKRRHLQISSVRKVCVNSSTVVTISSYLLVLTGFLLFFFK